MTRSFLLCASAAVLLAVTVPAPGPALQDGDEPPKPPMEQWEKEVRTRLDKDAKLKALAAKHRLVLLHSRKLYAGGHYKQSAYSFICASADEKTHRNSVHLLFDNGTPNTFMVNMTVGQQNLLVDLGQADFTKNPDPAKISIDHPGVVTVAKAVEGHVYLERIRDQRGNNFYVLLQVVAVDKGGRYMAFLWRMLPGGKIVPPEIGKIS
jgi:hypothetical protein